MWCLGENMQEWSTRAKQIEIFIVRHGGGYAITKLVGFTNGAAAFISQSRVS